MLVVQGFSSDTCVPASLWEQTLAHQGQICGRATPGSSPLATFWGPNPQLTSAWGHRALPGGRGGPEPTTAPLTQLILPGQVGPQAPSGA